MAERARDARRARTSLVGDESATRAGGGRDRVAEGGPLAAVGAQQGFSERPAWHPQLHRAARRDALGEGVRQTRPAGHRRLGVEGRRHVRLARRPNADRDRRVEHGVGALRRAAADGQPQLSTERFAARAGQSDGEDGSANDQPGWNNTTKTREQLPSPWPSALASEGRGETSAATARCIRWFVASQSERFLPLPASAGRGPR